ncbi:unnamed protein product [Rotaria sp. Silwood2]|nr:unnamed protein product [Rotaria sp. Silwood2]CAF4322288.1 unnamed protein product [Rotaria sp. Silwood2]
MNNLHIYALLRSDKPDDFDLQLLTDKEEKKLLFKRIANLQAEKPVVGGLPYLYYLEFTNETGKYAQSITSYYLRISAAGTISNWHYQEDKELRKRQWFDVNAVNHQFLLSVDFQRGTWRTKPPCTSVLYWDQLWQYTYFIIQQNDIDLFDRFIEQFSITCIDFSQPIDVDLFFQQCFIYLPTIRNVWDDIVHVSIVIVRMIGLLNIGQRPLQKQESIAYIDMLLQSILNKIEPFFNSINENHWLLVKDGLTNLLSLKFQIYAASQKNDSITFINLIPHTHQYQQQVADSVAKQITLSNIKPTQPNWLDLFKMTTDDHLILECLQLANTFKEYINYAERLLNSKTIQNIKEHISDNLKAMIRKNHFELTFENILFLFKTLKTDCKDDLRNILEQSEELSSYIANYLNMLRITDKNQLRSLYQVFNEYYNPYLLRYIGKTSYISNILKQHNFVESRLLTEFHIEWFNCFLCDPHYTNSDEEASNFRYFLDNWLKQFTHHLPAYIDLIKSLDILIPMLENSENKNKTSTSRDINYSKRFTEAQKRQFDKIWQYVQKFRGQQPSMAILLNNARKEMEEKSKIKEKVQTCLKMYCEKADDIQQYQLIIDDLTQQLITNAIKSIQIPNEILGLVPFADVLNPYNSSKAWLSFRQNQQNSCDKNKSVDKSVNPEKQQTSTEVPINSCLDILQKTCDLFQHFTKHLESISKQWKTIPIQTIIMTFKDIDLIENEMQLLTSLLEPSVIPPLTCILDYWRKKDNVHKLCKGFDHLVKFYNLSGDYKFLSVLDNMTEATNGDMCYINYQQFQEGTFKKYSEEVLTVCLHYNDSKKLVDFVERLNRTDMDNLLEAVNDWDESFITTQTIMDFVQLGRFLTSINNYSSIIGQTSKTLNNILSYIDTLLKQKEYSYIISYFQTCLPALPGIQRLYLELTDKEESKRTKIFHIINKSSLKITEAYQQYLQQDNSKKYDVCVKIDKGGQFNYYNLHELRDRARLIEYSGNERNVQRKYTREQEIQFLRCFVSLVDVTENMLGNLNHLNVMGYPAIEKYSENEYKCVKCDFSELNQLNVSLKNTVELWEGKLIELYKCYPELTYLSGKQFWTVEKALQNNKELKSQDQDYHLLKYIGIENFSSTKFIINENLKPEERLEILGKVLNEQRRCVIKPLSVSENSISPDRQGGKISIIETSIEGRYRAILSLFHHDNSDPAVNQILFCTTETNWIDVRAFFYRCFYSSSNLYQLIEPERLEFNIQDKCCQLIIKLVENNPSHKFKLSIITTEIQTHLINAILRMDTAKTVRDNELLNEDDLKKYVKQIVKNCHLVSSTMAGLGKTTFIQNHAQKFNRNLIKFPITGDSSFDQIGERLLLITTSNAIHFDIGSVENINLLNSILFCLCLFRSYCFSQTVIYLPMNTLFYFELESSPFFKLNQDMFIFRYLESTEIDEFNLNNVRYGETRLLYVTRYLYAIDKKIIKDKEINIISEQSVTNSMCIDLLNKYFIQNKDKKYLSWTQLKIFINVFYHLFNGFSNCGYFRVDALQEPKLRMDIIQTFLNSSNQFTSISVKSVRENQVILKNGEQIDDLLNKSIIRWDTTQPFTVVFTHSNDPLFVYRAPKDVPTSLQLYFNALSRKNNRWLAKGTNDIFTDYNQLDHLDLFFKLVSLSIKYWNKAICKQCFKQYPYQRSTCTECKIPLRKPKSTDTNDIKQFQKEMAEILEREYVITPDNYIKMLLVWLRISSDVPVIIMGETVYIINHIILGCGKTALINFLCHKILDDELYIFHVHAGITNVDITDTIGNQSIRAIELAKVEKRLWIFFDEFNTTKSVGLFKEIMCERTLLGKQLPSNMVFLAACNPRRLKTEKNRSDDNIGIEGKNYERQKTTLGNHLLYTVVPTPETMIEYIYDYGHLDSVTERKYIEAILRTCTDLANERQLFTTMVNGVCQSQLHLRSIEDVSSVSLRDVARYRLIYNWYYDTFNKRENNVSNRQNMVESGILALMLCYYFRLRSSAEKTNYINMLKKSMSFNQTNNNFIEQILQKEQDELIKRMKEKPVGTAINRALRDNLFVMFVCILNRIPIILCGKPGCSKTLAIQIIISNLKGKKSNDLYFQQLPELIAVSYQGTKSCKSESIQLVFERAKKYSDAKTQTELLPVIVFDEIGLAELSPYNPLKVLHKELEIENCKYGFVAISNWRLDASKMNRALYLACPDPTIEDLQLTATTIHKSINENQYIQLNDDIMNGLAHSYLELCYKLKENPSHENYFGLRDFYSLIKGIVKEFDRKSKELKQNIENKILFDIIRKQLAINFDGIIDGSEYMWKRFCYYTKHEDLINQYEPPNFKEILNHSLNDRSGRYLMLISDSDSLIDYIERYLSKIAINIRELIGSQIKDDLNSEAYDYRILMDVILYAEKTITLIMRKMDKCYSSLYDLYNQSFSISGQKKYCRIALGSTYHPKCLVNDKFYCIVLVNAKDVEKSDPPFLNRFEKHKVEFKDLIEPLHLTITQNLLLWFERLLTIKIGKKHFIQLQHLFVNFNCDYICNVVIDAFELDQRDQDDVINHCKNVLMHSASSDLPLLLSLQNENDNKEYAHLCEQYYLSKKNSTLESLLKNISSNMNQHIIYTYTQIYDNINYPKNIKINIDEVKLANFKTELELINKMKVHFQTSTTIKKTTTDSATNIDLLLIRVDYYNDRDHILSLKHNIVNIYNEFENNQIKHIWIIFHLQRNILTRISNDVLFNGWSSIMIENLNDNEQKQLLQYNVLQQPSYQYLINERLFSSQFYDLFDKCLSQFRYNITNITKKYDINKRRNELLQHFYNDQPGGLSDIMIKNIGYLIENVNDKSTFADWRLDLITNNTIAATARSFYDAFQMTIANFYEMYFLLLFSNLEKQALIDSYLFMTTKMTAEERKTQELYRHIW